MIDAQRNLVYWRNRESPYQIHIELSQDLKDWTSFTPETSRILAEESPFEQIAVPLKSSTEDLSYIRLRLEP
jgi:hypothetical protein